MLALYNSANNDSKQKKRHVATDPCTEWTRITIDILKVNNSKFHRIIFVFFFSGSFRSFNQRNSSKSTSHTYPRYFYQSFT